MRDYGVGVSSRFPHSPLAKLPAGALRLWLLLAAKADHAPFTRTIGGVRVTVKTGQVLTSLRQMEADGFGTRPTLVHNLRTLTASQALTLTPVERLRSFTASGKETKPLGRSKNFTAGLTLATLVSVQGFKQLREGGGKETLPKRTKGVSDGLTAAEREENRRAIAQLEAEGR